MSHFSPSCLPLSCSFYTPLLFTYFDVRATLNIPDFRLPSDRRTILIGRGPHLAMISSPRRVLIWMNIWEFLPPWTTLSNYPSTNNLIPYWNPYRNCRKNLNLVSQFRNTKKRVGQVWELRNLKPVPLQKAARTGNFALANPGVSPCSARRGEPRLI